MDAPLRASIQAMTVQWCGARAATLSTFSASQSGCRPKQSRCSGMHVAAAASVVLLAAERLCLAEVSFLSAELGIQGCKHPERSATATRRGLMAFWWQPFCWVEKG